jgi:hypothetical protein
MEFAEGGAGALPELNEADFDHTDPDAAQADGRGDLVAELVGPVPCIVIAMILGLDRGPLSLEVTWETA